MRILFIYPNILRYPAIPIGISSLISLLNGENECFLFDATFIDDENLISKFIKKVENSSPDIIAIHCTSSDWKLVQILLSELKKSCLHKTYLTVIGGAHPTAAPDEVISSPFIDILVIGEGELVIKELIEKLNKDEDICHIRNCWVKKNGIIYKNKLRTLIKDLDLLPYPAWRVFNKRHITHYIKEKSFSWSKRIAMETSRGCPYACTYCMNSHIRNIYKGLGRFCREKSVDRIINEAKNAKENLGIDYIQFVDDNFVGSKKRLRELSVRFPKEVGIPSFIQTLANNINGETIKLLAEMNVIYLGIGVETGNEIYRNKILNKNVSNDQIIRAFRLAEDHGIVTLAYYMIGLPLEKRYFIEKTIEFNNKVLHPDVSFVSTFFPFPGTVLYNAVSEKGLIEHYDYLPDFYHGSILKFDDLDSKDLENLRKQFLNVMLDTGPFKRRNLNKLKAQEIF